jgi:hypothetical protein
MKTPEPVPVASMIQPFIDADIVPPGCRRVIIDLAVGDIVRIYYEVLGDKVVIDVLSDMIKRGRLPRLGDLSK